MFSCGCGCMYEKVVKDFLVDWIFLYDMKGIIIYYFGLVMNVILEK